MITDVLEILINIYLLFGVCGKDGECFFSESKIPKYFVQMFK